MRRRSAARAAWLCAGGVVAALAACELVAGIEDVSPLPQAATGGAVASGGPTGGGGGGASSSTGGGGATTVGSAGATQAGGGGGGGAGAAGGGGALCDDALTTDGLVMRYWMDDGTAVKKPATLADDAPSPLVLVIAFGATAGWVLTEGHKGLEWKASGSSGQASKLLNLTKAGKLDTLGTFTLEIVAELKEPASKQTMLFAIDDDNSNQTRLGVAFQPDPAIDLWLNGVTRGRFGYTLTGRHVLHTIVDTTQGNGERTKLYIDGGLAAASLLQPAANEPLDLGLLPTVRMGNTAFESSSMAGTIHFAAVYNQAFEPQRAKDHAAKLLVRDDRCSPP
jgi:hypothetical protein